MRKQEEADFLGWVTAQRSGLRKTAYLLCGDWFLADDLVQEALTRLYAVWPRVSGAGEPGPYVRKVIVNLYVDHRRRPSRRELPSPDAFDGPAPEIPSPSDGDRDELMAALREVPRGQRAVLVLRYWEDLSIQQTAATLGTSESNVRSQASRGLDALRTAMQRAADTTEPEEAS